MVWRVPRSLHQYCRDVLPLLLAHSSGDRMLEAVAAVLRSDRWNSFDRFHETTETLVGRYRAVGAQAEVYPVQTGGRIGSGRWVIQEAADILGASVEVVSPVHRRVLDYAENPWHVIQWSTSTPAAGLECRLAIVDDMEELGRLGPEGLRGAAVLSRLGARELLRPLADRGAAALIVDRAAAAGSQALQWTKFGWGAIAPEAACARLVGYVVSADQGRQLRELARTEGEVRLRLRADIRRYVGTHDVVSGLVPGSGDPQDEVWAIAHSAEPGAVDNASGVAVCLEIARVLEELIRAGRLRRPKRSIRLVNAYECYGFFAFLERVRRLQPPLAGVCLDALGTRPEACDGRLEWHATVPASAGFVDRAGATLLRAALRQRRPGYRLHLGAFQSTADTLIGDPRYGFPCPWLTSMYRRQGSYAAYHNSADTVALLDGACLEAIAGAMAGYLHYLADMDTEDVLAWTACEAALAARALGEQEPASAAAASVRAGYAATEARLRRWLWGGERPTVMARLRTARARVEQAAPGGWQRWPVPRALAAAVRRVPRRTAPLTPTLENTPEALAARLRRAGLDPWTLYWADGRRSIAEIAALAAGDRPGAKGGPAAGDWKQVLQRHAEFFAVHAELGYVQLMDPQQMWTRARLTGDLRRLGVRPGMDLMVHSSLSALGPVAGGAETVVAALLAAIGPRGTLLMPSFNHRAARVYNPLTTPTTNGAIPDAMWRRPDAVRSLHPTHAVAAIGPRAEHYCRGHVEAGVWAEDSPIGRLIHGGGYLLCLGTTHNTSTAYHVAEISMPCRCIDMFGADDVVVMPDGNLQRVRGLAFRAGPCPVPTSKLDETLDRRGLQRRGKVGQADSALCRAIDLWRVRREHLRGVCATCTVRPQRARG